jgi:hypothetical protein
MDKMGVRRLHGLTQMSIPAENHTTAAANCGRGASAYLQSN